MYPYASLREVHVELTSRCNAACPQCPRNLSGGAVNPALPLAELSLDDVRALFPTPFLGQLRKLYACGNYGDPMVARDVLPIFQDLRARAPRLELGLFTNGSGRTPAFWRELAQVVSWVRFSIDGLEDTNHLYRRGTSWDRIVASVEAFVGAGGRAEWDFIVFRHNEHQIEEAKALAKTLGFSRFFLKKTSRFFGGAAGLQKTLVRGRDGEPDYEIEEPSSEDHRNPVARRLAQADLAAYQATTDIACKAARWGRIYVSAEGLVFPCCWTGALYPPGRAPKTGQLWDLVGRLPGGVTAIDGRVHGIEAIVNGPFFQTLVPEGWAKRSVAEGRLEACVKACGGEDLTAAQYGASLL